jgi:transposase
MNSLNKTAHSRDCPDPAGDASPPPVQIRDAEIIQLTELINSQKLTIHSQDIKIQALVQEVAYLRRIRYGAKSEAMSAEQRQLFEDDIVQDVAAVEAELKLPPAPATPRSRAGRQALPEHLQRVEVRHEPESCTCSACQANLIKIGEDVSEQLDIEPARFFVIRHIRPQYACRQCETVTAAAVAPAVIDGSLAAPGLLTWVAISKYMDHLPLYRLEQIAARQQVTLSRSTMSEWIGRMGFALQPLADRLMELLKSVRCCMPTRRRLNSWIPGRARPNGLTCGVTAATIWILAHRLWCSITRAAARVSMRETSCGIGRVASWWMIMADISSVRQFN